MADLISDEEALLLSDEDVVWIEGKDIVAIPNVYLPDFLADPRDALLKFGCLPQRARAPWFTRIEPVDKCMVLPDMVSGPASERHDAKLDYRALVASPRATALLDGISPHFHASDAAYWHVHIDNALGKKREGDSAGIALGRISHSYEERATDHVGREYRRVVRTFEIPLAAQVIAPIGDQIYLGAFARLAVQLKQMRGFNITSFSVDGYASAQLQQELMLAGMVTAGMHVDEHTGEVTGLPKPYSVDRSAQPHRDLLEAVNEGRVAMPRYALLRKELSQLEFTEPSRAPDHPVGGSKDVADAVAGAIGYLSVFGHAELVAPQDLAITGSEVLDSLGLPKIPSFVVEGDDPLEYVIDDLTDPISFDVP